jgi:hypothetical protein
VAAGVAAVNADAIAAGQVTAFNKATGAKVAKGDIAVSGAVDADVSKYGTAQPITYTVAIDTNSPQASGQVDFFTSAGTIIGETDRYVIFGVTPQYLVAPGVAAANADLVAAASVTAFDKITGAKVAKADIRVAGVVSADPAFFGSAQTVIYSVGIDPVNPQTYGTVDFYVSAGSIIGENADYIIYGVTPTYLVVPRVAAANADLVLAGQVTAFNKATGAKVDKTDIVASGTVSADASRFGLPQPITYTVAIDTNSPQTSGQVDFYVSTGTIIGENAAYIIYGVTPQFLDAPGVPGANADLVVAGQVTAFDKVTGAPVPPSAIVATGTVSADGTFFGAAQPIRYTVAIDSSNPQASGYVDFITSGGVIIARSNEYVIYGANPTYIAEADLVVANADLVAAGQVTAFNRTTGTRVPSSEIEATGTLDSGLALYGKPQPVSYRIKSDPASPRIQGSVDFYVAAPTYMLAYDGNGHDSGNVPAPTFHTAGDVALVAASDLGRNGYEFLGYSEDKAASIATYQTGDAITMMGDVVLYAVWQKAPEPSSPIIPLTGDTLLLVELALFALATSIELLLILLFRRRRGHNRSEALI